MKILHTSDWHLGRALYGRQRYDEFSLFLDWLIETIEKQKIDCLLVAGDVFDTSIPSNKAQELYYNFLCQIKITCCMHVVIIAGNHDSPSFLNAPKELLRNLNVHIVGAINNNLHDEVVVLYDKEIPQAIICAVPYLKDRDIRKFEAGESIDDKNAKLVLGVKNHYNEVCSIAEKRRDEFIKQGYENIPIICMGHLFTQGGVTLANDGVRELYVGTLAYIDAALFPSSIDYFALGHLHVPQKVGNREHIRYCGSPIPMGYGEAKQEKKVVIIEFNNNKKSIEEVTIPRFQELIRISSSLDDIYLKLAELKNKGSRAWLEIEYTGNDFIENLHEKISDCVSDSSMEILKIKNRRVIDTIISKIDEETLEDISENDVFIRLLDSFNVANDSREELTSSYNEVLKTIQEEDINEK